MINLAVINLKDIINFIKKFFIGIIIFIIFLKICSNIKNEKYVDIKKLREKSYFDYCEIINNTLTISNYYQRKEKTINRSGIKKILGAEFVMLELEEELMEKENQEEILEFEEKSIIANEEENINEEMEASINVDENLKTIVISENNKTDTYTDIYKNVKIKNESKYQLSEEILNPNFNLLNRKDIVIYHTHTCESYTPTQQNNYMASGNFRTTDLNYNVVRVGNELAKNLINNNFNVIHNNTFHDYPAYSGSYTRSLSTIKNIVNENYSRFSN